MKKDAYNVAVAGATGAVGQVMLKVLEERKFPVDTLKPLASSRSVGKKVRFRGEDVEVQLLSKDSFEDIDIALFSAGAGRSLDFAPAAAEAGAVVVDNSSAYRQDPDIPLVVPEVNAGDVALYTNKGIIANPNCTTIIMAVPLKPLYDLSRIERIIVSTYQSASGAGAMGMAELEDQSRAWADGKPIEVNKFPYQIAFNLFPHVDVFLENKYSKEEMKMVHETHKIFHDYDIAIGATTVRVPVFSAHSEAIWLKFARAVTPKEAREALEGAPGVKVVDDLENNMYPTPLMASDQDLCMVGRIREDLTTPGGLVLWVSGDQLRKGAATNTVQIAEELIKDYL